MSKEPEVRAQIKDFPGMQTEVDEHDRKNGIAVEQVNAISIKQGELVSRYGYREVSFDSSGDVTGTG